MEKFDIKETILQEVILRFLIMFIRKDPLKEKFLFFICCVFYFDIRFLLSGIRATYETM